MADLVNFNVADNIAAIFEQLNQIERQQVPFAIVGGLNATAFRIRREGVASLEREFVLRNKGVAKRLRVTKATKTRLEARVGHPDWFMEDQELGDTRRPSAGYEGPPEGAGQVWIPSVAMRRGGVFEGKLTARLRTVQRQMVRAAERHAARRAKGKKRRGKGKAKKPAPFVMKTRSGTKGVFVRSTSRTSPPQLLYVLKDSVRIDPRWRFVALGQKIARRHLMPDFLKALDKGLKTARSGPEKSAFVGHLLRTGGGGAPLQGGVLGAMRNNVPT